MQQLQDIRDSRLYQLLQTRDPELAVSVLQCWNVAEKELNYVAAIHPTFTSHGADHPLSLIMILDAITLDAGIELNEHEIYILLCATILHDIGMVGPVEADAAERKRIRDVHHLRSMQRITEKWQMYGLQKPYVEMIAEGAAAHRKIVISDVREIPVGVMAGSPPRARLCAVLLRIVDECHVTSDRVPEDYEFLKLPSESIQHFLAHQKTTGIRFDARQGIITFAVTIETENHSRFMRAVRDKIQSEINNLAQHLLTYNIPYRTVELNENRDKVIKKKLYRILLQKAHLSEKDLLTLLIEDGEEVREVERYLSFYESILPIESNAQVEKTYSLKSNTETLKECVGLFITEVERKSDPFTLMSSQLCRQVTNTAEFISLVRSNKGPTDPIETILLVSKSSPSALEHILTMKDRSAPPTFVVSGLYYLFIGLLEQDIARYPQILLKPDLIDTVFQEGALDQKKYEQLRTLQGSVYLEAFDISKVMQQWVTPDSVSDKADEETSQKSLKGNFTFTHPGDTGFSNVMLLFAAAQRLKLPVAMQETDKIRIKMEVEGLEKPTNVLEGSAVLVIDPKVAPPFVEVTRSCPAFVTKNKDGEYNLIVNTTHDGTLEAWKRPLAATLKITELGPSKDPEADQGWNIHYTLTINWQDLDCEQAEILIEASESNPTTMYVTLGESTESITVKVNATGFPTIKIDPVERDLIKKLAQLQKILAAPVPFPLIRLGESDQKLLDVPISSKENAREIIEQLKKVHEEDLRYFTPFVVEIWLDGKIIERRSPMYLQGHHALRLNPRIGEETLENVRLAMGDPTQGLQIFGDIKIPAHVATNNIVRIALDSDDEHTISTEIVRILNEERSDSIENTQTKLNIYWHPAEDKILFKATPFRIALTPYLDYERWGIESEYFSERNDLERSYFAAKEAYRIRPEDARTRIRYGWLCFKAGNVGKALEVMKGLPADANNENHYLASINCGLFYLVNAHVSSQPDSKLVREAVSSYISALDRLDASLPSMALRQKLQLIIDDLQSEKSFIGEIGQRILDMFSNVASGDISLEIIREKLSNLSI